MQNVLIVGNVTKDVYLRYDNRKNNFEIDQNNTPWLDLAFDGSAYKYYSRAAIYGGASISLEIFSRFGLKASISNTPATFLDGQFIAKEVNTTYRYILCQDENVAYLTPSEKARTTWKIPDHNPDWIYIDRSATITPLVAEEILGFVNLSQSTRLALFIGEHSNQYSNHMRALIERADIIITDVEFDQKARDLIRIGEDYIEFHNKRVPWTLNSRQDIVTRLSSHLNIAATILAARMIGKPSSEALLLARANVQDSNLGSTSSLQKLENSIADSYYLVQKFNDRGPKMLEVENNAKLLLARGKGILAADESGGSIHKKFEGMNIPDDEQHRRDYRNIFFTTPNLKKYVNGIILFDETARQLADNGQDFISFLASRGIMSGIKVDQGLVNFDNSDEKYTQGLEGLPERLAEYYHMGARFAKWRAAFEITDHSPSDMAMQKNAEILAQYAADCQQAGIVPIVEPELVYDGDYTIDQNIEYTGRILDCLFAELKKKNVSLPGCVLKVNMVLAGKRQEHQSTPEEVGSATAQVLRMHVPGELAGVVFLSGGQSVEQATANLQAVTNEGPFPWPVTFSFARALQDPALHAWQGNNDNADAAREAFRLRLVANADALHKK